MYLIAPRIPPGRTCEMRLGWQFDRLDVVLGVVCASETSLEDFGGPGARFGESGGGLGSC